ncbi:MAG: glycosyltransferase [Bacilli bacterium]
MRIIILILDISATGGTERAVSNLANMLASADHSVSIISICTSFAVKPYFDLAPNVTVNHLGLSQIPSSVVAKIQWFYHLYHSINRLNIDNKPTVFIGTGHNINILIPLFKSKNVRSVACEHIQLDSIPLLSIFLMKIMYTRLDLLVVLSKSAKQKMLHSIHLKNIKIIPNTLPFIPQSSSSLLNNRIIMVGRLSSEKGYDRVLGIASFLKNKYPEWSIDIFGNGPLGDYLHELFYIENGLYNIHLRNSVKNIQDEYLNSSIFIMTSLSEAMPMVLLEAKSCGLPVVAYECEGVNMLVENEVDGFVIESGNLKEFNSKLELLINDFQLRKKMSTNCIVNSREYVPSKIFESWDNELKKLFI